MKLKRYEAEVMDYAGGRFHYFFTKSGAMKWVRENLCSFHLTAYINDKWNNKRWTIRNYYPHVNIMRDSEGGYTIAPKSGKELPPDNWLGEVWQTVS